MAAVASEKNSFTTGSSCCDLTGNNLVFWIGDRSCLREMVAHGGSMVETPVRDRPKYEGLTVVEPTEGLLRSPDTSTF